MSRPLTILYFKDQLYKLGGSEKVTIDKLNGWVQYTNNKIHVVTIEQKGRPFSFALDNKVKTHDLAVNYDRKRNLFGLKNACKTTRYIYKFWKLIRQIKPDVIVSVRNGPVNLFLPFIAGSAQTINEYHTSGINWHNTRNAEKKSVFDTIYYKIHDLIERRYSRCIVLNGAELNYYKGKNFAVMPNPIPIPNYEIKIRKKIVVAAGGIIPRKGYDLLIKSWKIVNEKHPDWELKIYGLGIEDLKRSLEDQIIILSLEKSIDFCGFIKDVNNVFFESSIHALSSRQESFGMVIIETQACGLPTVAFDCPTGPRHIIQEGVNGYLVEPGNIEAFAEKIVYLIEHPEIREEMGKKAKENAEQKYSMPAVLKQWEALFESVKKP